MRKKLTQCEGGRKKFKGVFSRLGKKTNYKGYSEETILLKDIIDIELNEIVAALQDASNRLINIEDLDEFELETLHRHYQTLATFSKNETDIFSSHSVDEAERRHKMKRKTKS